MKDATTVDQVSLSRKWFETDGNKDVREIDVLEDRRTTDPTDEIQRQDLKDLITKGLIRAERLILILYYFEEMTMKEIGATLDLSESRVSQMHSSHHHASQGPDGQQGQGIRSRRRITLRHLFNSSPRQHRVTFIFFVSDD